MAALGAGAHAAGKTWGQGLCLQMFFGEDNGITLQESPLPLWTSCNQGQSLRRLSWWQGERWQGCRSGCLELAAPVGRPNVCPISHSFPPCAVATCLFLGYVRFTANMYRTIGFWCVSVPSHYKHLNHAPGHEKPEHCHVTVMLLLK